MIVCETAGEGKPALKPHRLRAVHQFARAGEAGVDAPVHFVQSVLQPEGQDVAEQVFLVRGCPVGEICFGVHCGVSLC